jgi:hypothetical protein
MEYGVLPFLSLFTAIAINSFYAYRKLARCYKVASLKLYIIPNLLTPMTGIGWEAGWRSFAWPIDESCRELFVETRKKYIGTTLLIGFTWAISWSLV